VLEKSLKYAEENKLEKWNNVLIPRSKGFELCLQDRECFDYVTDITIAFEKPYGVKLGKEQPPTMFDFLKENLKKPLNIHVHVKKYKIDEIPKESKEIELFLNELFKKKEELLNYFELNNKFPGGMLIIF
jgi:hypothetical protein